MLEMDHIINYFEQKLSKVFISCNSDLKHSLNKSFH